MDIEYDNKAWSAESPMGGAGDRVEVGRNTQAVGRSSRSPAQLALRQGSCGHGRVPNASLGIDVQVCEDRRASLMRGEKSTMIANQDAPGGDAATSLGDRLDRIERLLATLVGREAVRDWYDIEEFAGLVGKAPFTVREWARLGRIHADKRRSGGGRTRRGSSRTPNCSDIASTDCCRSADLAETFPSDHAPHRVGLHRRIQVHIQPTHLREHIVALSPGESAGRPLFCCARVDGAVPRDVVDPHHCPLAVSRIMLSLVACLILCR